MGTIYSLEQIQSQAQRAALLYETVNDACPYPFGTPEANAFTAFFRQAKEELQKGIEP